MIDQISSLFDSNLNHVKEKLSLAVVQSSPFPYMYVGNIFTEEFYNHLKLLMPPDDACPFVNDLTGYTNPDFPNNRRLLPLKAADIGSSHLNKYVTNKQKAQGIQDFCGWLNKYFLPLLINKFCISLPAKYREELLYIIDTKGYYLAPHSDASAKILSALFYMPEDDSTKKYGTNILIPQEPGFVDDGNTFYKNRQFDIHWTAPFVPNSLLVILKTNNSFHSTSEITDSITRRLLIYDIQTTKSIKIGVHGVTDTN